MASARRRRYAHVSRKASETDTRPKLNSNYECPERPKRDINET
jgi:hypothetical protein